MKKEIKIALLSHFLQLKVIKESCFSKKYGKIGDWDD